MLLKYAKSLNLSSRRIRNNKKANRVQFISITTEYFASNVKYGAETHVSSKAVFTFFMTCCFMSIF